MVGKQTCKMSDILPEQDCSFRYFTRKCLNDVDFKIVRERKKQLNLSANTTFTTFTSLKNFY